MTIKFTLEPRILPFDNTRLTFISIKKKLT